MCGKEKQLDFRMKKVTVFIYDNMCTILEPEREVCPLIHSPNAHSSWAWARPLMGDWLSLQLVHVDDGDPST